MQQDDRQDGKKEKKRDFSCSDRKFAANIGIKFHTPDEFFEKEKPAPFEWGSVNPQQVLDHVTKTNMKAFIGPAHEMTSKQQEMILMVGMQASGKSHFVKKYLVPNGYERINRDTLKTQEKCLAAAQAALKNGGKVVIDNTNPDPKSRAKYIALAREFNIPCRCFWMTTPRKLADHLNVFRENVTGGKVPRIPDIAYNVYQKNFKDPDLDEGFAQIRRCNFIPEFRNEKERQLFLKWT